MSYEHLLLLDPDLAVSPEDVRDALSGGFSNATCTRNGPDITLRLGNTYMFRLHMSAEPWVLAESQEIATLAEHPKRDRVAQAHTRLELSGDEDPDGDHFNDLVFLLEALEILGPIYAFHQATATFPNADWE